MCKAHLDNSILAVNGDEKPWLAAGLSPSQHHHACTALWWVCLQLSYRLHSSIHGLQSSQAAVGGVASTGCHRQS